MNMARSLVSAQLIKLGCAFAVTALVVACAPSPEQALGILQSDAPPDERAAAVRVLATSDDPAYLEAVVAALDYPALEVITAAQEGLSEIAEPGRQREVVTAIVRNGIPAENAGPVLRAYGDSALRLLIPETSGSGLTWPMVAPHLMQLPDEAAFAEVAAGLGHASVDVRRQAIDLLLSQPDRTGALLEARIDAALRVRPEIGASEAPIGMLFDPISVSQTVWRANAAMVLNRIEPERHADRVIATLLATGPPAEGAETLGNLAARAEAPVMHQLGAKDADAARRATELVVLWAFPSAVPVLREILKDPQRDPQMRGNAAEALAAQHDAETLQLLPGVMRQAYDAEQEWMGYQIELEEREAWAEEEEGADGEELAEDAADDPEAEEEWDPEFAEPIEELIPPELPQGDYAGLRRQLLDALAQYGQAAVVPILAGISDVIVVDLDEAEAVDLGEDGYLTSGDARGALRTIGPTLDTLLAAWDGSGNVARQLILEFLEPVTDPRAEELLLGLLDEDAELAGAAVRALARSPDPPRDRLVAMLRATDSTGAARVLGALPADEASVDALIGTLGATDDYARQAAADALGRFGNRSAIEPLAQRLSQEKSGFVQAAIVGALGRMPDARAIPALIRALPYEEAWGEEIARKEEFSAARALAAIGEPAREPLLESYRNSEGGDRRGPLLALAYLDPVMADALAGEWFDALVENLSWEEWEDFEHVLRVMGITAQPASAGRLVRFARSQKEGEARYDVAVTVSMMREPVVHEWLTEVLAQEDLELIAAAHRFYIREAVGEDLLVAAIQEYGDEDMALDYLNCGNAALEEAAETWARENGYLVLYEGGEQRAVWGGH